ncbi:MAG: CHASE4 domain-containing protein [Candidatus Eremiobacterota bacterium]
MNIRKKTLIVIIITFIFLIILLYIISRVILLGGFIDLEKKTVTRNVERAVNALQDEYISLAAITGDWAPWDETYKFIEDLNKSYINDNLNRATLVNLRVNLIFFINSSGEMVFSKGVDLVSGKEIHAGSLNGFLSDTSPLLNHQSTTSSVVGIIMFQGRPMIVSSRPILTNEWKGPSRGTLIMGRFIDDAEVNRLRDITSLSINIYKLSALDLPYDVRQVKDHFLKETGIFVRPLNRDYTAGYIMLKDIYGQPVLILKVDMVREIYLQGKRSLYYFILSFLVVAIVLGMVNMLLLDMTVLSRLYLLSNSVDNIGLIKDLSLKKLLPGEDEIASLACTIDSMLERLDASSEQIRHADRLATIGKFASGIAHELNEPLGNILGFAQLAKQYPSLPEQTVADLEKIEKSSLYAREIVKKLLLFARQVPSHKVTLNINEIIKDSLYFFEGKCEQSGIEVIIQLSETLPPVTADPSQMTQILINLVTNAIHAMPDGGMLEIKTYSSEDSISLIVADTGKGMNDETKKHIFNPFFTTKDVDQGTGLGLAVVHGIVSSHGGHIKIDSKEGNGARFEIQIPLT